jgi:hypothetical protein
VTDIKRISEHVGAEHEQGGNVCSTFENKAMMVIPVPTQPAVIPPAAELSTAQAFVFKGQINQCIRRSAVLEENMQEACSLVLGQCTKLLQTKLKQSNGWNQVSTVFDLLGLTKLVKSVIFKFDNQKFLPVLLHQAKKNSVQG